MLCPEVCSGRQATAQKFGRQRVSAFHIVLTIIFAVVGIGAAWQMVRWFVREHRLHREQFERRMRGED
jgi:hypothetical protein